MDDQTASLLSSLQSQPHSPEGLIRLLEGVEQARVALVSDQDGLHELAERLVRWSLGCEDGCEAAQVLVETARILIEHAGDWEYGVELYERALKRAPTEMAALHCVQELLSEREAWERLEAVLLTHASALDYDALFEVEHRGQAWRRLGQLRASRLSDLDGAIVVYDTAIEVYPEPTWMLELAELYDQRQQGDDRTAAAALYYRAADIIDGPTAIPYLERALDRDPYHEAALDMLEALTPAEDAVRCLEQRWRTFAADAPAGEKRASVVRRLANHYAQGVASPKALEKLSRALSPSPPSNWAAKLWFEFRNAQLADSMRPTSPKSVRRWYVTTAAVCAASTITLWSAPELSGIGTHPSTPSTSKPATAAAVRSKKLEVEGHAIGELLPRAGLDAQAAQTIHEVEASPARLAPSSVTVLSGSMPEPEFTTVLADVQRRLEDCAATAGASKPGVHGSMALAWLVKPHGRPAKVRYRGGSVDDGSTRLCALSVLRDTRFPRPLDGGVSVEATFDLESQAQGDDPT